MVTVALSKKAIDRLKKMQKEGESISDVIIRLSNEEKNCDPSMIKKYEGSLENTELWEDTEKKLYASRLVQRE